MARKAVKGADAVLVSDYGSGLVTPKFVHELAGSLKQGARPILIDSRYALTKYRGLTACTPNESEVEQVLGVTDSAASPVRYDQSRLSAQSVFTDIMSIPPSVARRAYQAAEAGANSGFF